jgi:exoribonuclease-2
MVKAAPNALVWYKGRPALIIDLGKKTTIAAAAAGGTETLKVREKDIEVLHPGPVHRLEGFVPFNAVSLNTANPDIINDNSANLPVTDIQSVWELIESGAAKVDLTELAELVYGEFTPQSAWAARLLLAEGLYFTGTIDAVNARTAEEIGAAEEKRQGKAREGREREAFLQRMRDGVIDTVEDARFLQDVEALAYGKTVKSRTLKELGRTETPQEAHRLLLDYKFWDKWINPHPQRFGLFPAAPETSLSLKPAEEGSPAPEERSALGEREVLEERLSLERRDLTHLPAFAIDSPWSNDPDDALSLETENGSRILYVHVADPASEITSDSPADRLARARGATLYLPEGSWPMLGEDAVTGYALGLKGTRDKALTFKISLGSDGTPLDTEIFPSLLSVTRMSYEEADNYAQAKPETAAMLKELFVLAEQNLERRLNAGAVNISFPEVHISAANHSVQILPIVPCQSAVMVRECMLLAGEGAAAWAARRRLPFPYITQETGNLPAKPLPGLAGNFQIRRCMRPRAVSARPGYHCGLGLDGYSQVSSPRRRYTDFLAHQQVYAYLRKEKGESDGVALNEEEVLFRLAAGDAAAQAVTQAERASKSHWTAVYLDEILGGKTNGESLWDAIVTEKRANGLGIIIPGLGLEAQIGGSGELNETIKVKAKSVRIPELEIIFIQKKSTTSP